MYTRSFTRNSLIDFICGGNPCHVTALFLYSLKISESLWFSDVFGGYRKKPLAWNRLFSICSVSFSSNGRSHSRMFSWNSLNKIVCTRNCRYNTLVLVRNNSLSNSSTKKYQILWNFSLKFEIPQQNYKMWIQVSWIQKNTFFAKLFYDQWKLAGMTVYVPEWVR